MVLQLMSWPQQVPTLPSRTQLLNLQTENCSPKREKQVEKIPRLPGVHENSHHGKHPGCCSVPGLRKSMVLRGLPWQWGQSPPPKGATATANEISFQLKRLRFTRGPPRGEPLSQHGQLLEAPPRGPVHPSRVPWQDWHCYSSP